MSGGVVPAVKPQISGQWLAVALVGLLMACSQGKSAPKFESARVDKGTVSSKVTATGTLSA